MVVVVVVAVVVVIVEVVNSGSISCDSSGNRCSGMCSVECGNAHEHCQSSSG